jgi:peptidyl-tRNA hydrolase, PTH1 family
LQNDSHHTKLIVGLGNPGPKYLETRHNIGFSILDKLASEYGTSFRNERNFSSDLITLETRISYQLQKKIKTPYQEHVDEHLTEEILTEDGETQVINKTITNYITKYKKETIHEKKTKKIKLILAKPQTYMNNSGTAVSKIINYFKISPENLLVVHDDVSLETGKIKSSYNRGAGGQHGIEDIIEKLGGNKAFHRLKFGVGPDPGGEARANYVLAKFPKSEQKLLDDTITSSLFLIKSWLTEEDPQQISFES